MLYRMLRIALLQRLKKNVSTLLEIVQRSKGLHRLKSEYEKKRAKKKQGEIGIWRQIEQ